MLVAPSQPPHGRRHRTRILGAALLSCLVILGVVLLLGVYRSQRSFSEVHRLQLGRGDIFHERFSAVTPSTQKALQTVSARYIRALAANDYPTALEMTFTPFRRKQTPATLQTLIEKNFRPLTQVRDIQFASARVVESDQQVFLAMTLQCRDKQAYRTFFSFVHEESNWRLSNISPPVPVSRRGDVPVMLPLREP